MSSFDREALEKVFANLLGNAFKFTPAGGHVTLWAEPAANGATPMIDVTVADDGPGIAAEDLPHVFKRFYRAERSVTRVQPGTGLGLALAADMVELHGGAIRVDSVESQGARFTVRLPLLRDDERAALAPVDEAPLDARTVAAMADEIRVVAVSSNSDTDTDGATGIEGGPLVLVVDDHPDVREYVARHLRKRYRVALAADGLAALAAMRNETPDLVVSDVSMPGLDGYGLVSAIRNDPEFDFVPVILLTAAASADHRVAGLEGGADDCLTAVRDAEQSRVPRRSSRASGCATGSRGRRRRRCMERNPRMRRRRLHPRACDTAPTGVRAAPEVIERAWVTRTSVTTLPKPWAWGARSSTRKSRSSWGRRRWRWS